MEMTIAAPEPRETEEDARVVLLEPQADLPPGNTWRCTACGTRLRRGQPHSALEPYPHQAMNALLVRES